VALVRNKISSGDHGALSQPPGLHATGAYRSAHLLPIAGRERVCGLLTRRFSLLAQAPAPGLPMRRTPAAACITSSHTSSRSGNGAAAFGGGGGPSRYVARARWGTRRAAGAGNDVPGTSDDDYDDTSEGPSDQDRGAQLATGRHFPGKLPRALTSQGSFPAPGRNARIVRQRTPAMPRRNGAQEWCTGVNRGASWGEKRGLPDVPSRNSTRGACETDRSMAQWPSKHRFWLCGHTLRRYC
jgi:hypothetical protein